MSLVAISEAPSTCTLFSRNPALAKRASRPCPTPRARRSARWPVASVTPRASATTAAAAIRTVLGESPGSGAPPRPGGDAGFGEDGRLPLGLAGALARGFAWTRDPPRTAAGISVLRDPQNQLVESHTLLRRLLGDERGGGHAGLGVDLQKNQFVLNIVITEVRSGNAATTQ